ncbi:hypothetical protein HYDPIDRAFT_176205 [Hydnomerulius pinastri MD-312]|uniref:CoA carboxyltransferase C-terminal domain-containing protein n=1 Tax=Hydnomerulius pinastri MD-312 TaxID=994086 RepID=A0A0C9WDN4_9AGAM|nr:hypothetical protein HYDPIDRAFT_176205 [Hydnomerulius pinastri MD-312]
MPGDGDRGRDYVPPPKTESKMVDDGVTWEGPLARLRQQQAVIRTANPQDAGYSRQKQNGKLWVRERLDALLDSGSFTEIGSITGKPSDNGSSNGTTASQFTPANSVIGFGKLNGRRVFVVADDFSVRGGHADGGIAMKAPYGEIRLLDGSSGGGSVATYLATGATYVPPLAGLGQSMDALAVVPVVSALLGPVVGLGAAKAATSHFSVMLKDLSQMFAAGPPVVKQATFEELSKEELGGWKIHSANGSVDNIVSSEYEAFTQIRSFLSYMPSSIFVLPTVTTSTDACDRREEDLISVIPRRRTRAYDVRKVISMIVDHEEASTPRPGSKPTTSFFEIGQTWGRNIVTGLARLDGRPVGVLSSDCTVNGGALDAFGSQKTARFVNLCDHFGIPLLNLVDQPGFAIGSAAERIATIRHGASAISALYNATIPTYTVIIRRAFGVAGGAFADPEDGKNTRIAWPSGDWGSLPLEGGIEAAYKRQLEAAVSPAERDKLMASLLAQFDEVRSPLRTAHRFGIEEIVDPRDTRPLACEWAKHVYEVVLPPRLMLRQNVLSWDGKLPRGGYRL